MIPRKVTIMDRVRKYDGFFKIDSYDLTHDKFDGSTSGPIRREVFERGHSVAVLPYDSVADTVLLIRSFLIGSHLNGHGNFPVQVIAGSVGKGESNPEVAIREAEEEAGCTVTELTHLQTFLPSPGGSSEVIEVYLANVTLGHQLGPVGVFGLEYENEDIRAEVFTADEAIRMLDHGEITSGPAVVALLSFARVRAKMLSQSPAN